jgi:hypothetical protein
MLGQRGRRRVVLIGDRRGGHPRSPPTNSGTAGKNRLRGRVMKGVKRVTDWRKDRERNGRRVKMRRSCGQQKEEERQREGQ